LLGLNHDIGYEFAKDGSEHGRIGGKILSRSNYKYWKEVYFHGDINIEYHSLYLDILNLADMQVDKSGYDVGFDNRLIDIKSRYGEESEVYKKCNILITDLRDKYNL